MKAVSSAAKVACAVLAIACANAGWSVEPVATVENLVGTVSARSQDGALRIVAQESRIFSGEVIATEAESAANLKFVDGTKVAVRANSRMVVENFRYAIAQPERDSSVMNLAKGGMRTVTGLLAKRNPQAFETRSAVTTIAVRGTDYAMLICADGDANCGQLRVPRVLRGGDGLPLGGLYLSVFDGTVNASNNAGNRDFRAGKNGYIRDINTLPVEIEDDPDLDREFIGFHGIWGLQNPFDANPEVCLVK
jgi:hypothetical protein